MTRMWARILALALSAVLFAGDAHAADKPFVAGQPGIPPVFVAVQFYVARDAGFFKKYGVDVDIRQFDTGVADARAAAAGETDLTNAPTPVIINLVSNGHVPLVGIYGLEHPDWVLATTDPTVKSCKDLPGHPIAVDTPGGARSVVLRQLTAGCSYDFDTLQQVPVGASTAAAMIAGQVAIGVLHLDDVATIEQKSPKKLVVIRTIKQAKPISHYNLVAARADKLKADRDRYVRIVAALIDAARFMYDPKNLDRVAQIATVTGHTKAEAKTALKQFLAIEFWPKPSSDGLDRKRIEAEIAIQAKVGGIKSGNTPVTYDQLVDRTIWRAAAALVAKTK